MATAPPVRPIESHQVFLFLLACGVLLMLAIILGRGLSLFGVPAIVGELLAGVMLGPSMVGWAMPSIEAWLLPQTLEQFQLIDAVGQLSVTLLVGIVGTQVDLPLIRRLGFTVTRISGSGFFVPLVLGVACGLLLPASLLPVGANRALFAILIGVAISVSSIPVIAKTILDLDLLHRRVGQIILASATVDAFLGWMVLSVLTASITTRTGIGGLLISLAIFGPAIILFIVVGRPLFRALIKLVSPHGESGPDMAAVAAVILLGAAGTEALGLQAVLGAFLVGIVIRASGVLDLARLAPLRSVVTTVLAPVFFATAGLRMDLTTLHQPVTLLAAAVVLAVAVTGKFMGAFLGSMGSGISHWERLALGAGMNARGMIEVVVASVGLRVGLLSTECYTILILVAIATSGLAAPIMRWAMEHVDREEEDVGCQPIKAADYVRTGVA